VPDGNPGCGDVITLYLRAEGSEDRVAAVSFEGVGCTLSQAAASILAERTNRLQPTFEEILASPTTRCWTSSDVTSHPPAALLPHSPRH
jgi:hypothetical protein